MQRRYTPEYQKELDQLKTGETKEEKEEDVTEETEEAKAMRFAKEIEQEEKGEEVESAEKETAEKAPATNEEKERQLAMMNNRTKRLYERLEENASKKQKRIDTLKEKAKKASAKKGGNEQ